ncbi:MAG: hypothetical protein AAFN12_08315 [Cyanobacteria bacterium J06560_2]
MTFLDILGHFLSRQFPFWGICQLKFQPEQKTLYIHCRSMASRIAVIQDRCKLASLDIGVENVIITLSDYPDYAIELTPSL